VIVAGGQQRAAVAAEVHPVNLVLVMERDADSPRSHSASARSKVVRASHRSVSTRTVVSARTRANDRAEATGSLALPRQKDVARLQVAVQDAVPVGGLHGAGHRFEELGSLPGRQRRAGKRPPQTAARDELQRQV
jgi:hypothetical protein